MSGLSDAKLARELATSAGELLLALRDEMGFADPWALRDAGDFRSNVHLLGLLSESRPDDVVLSEESADDPRRHEAERLWIIDPLDGTTEFGEPGRTDWAVHVALWQRGEGLIEGAVALPARGVTLSTADPLPPRIWMASSVTYTAVSLANSFAIEPSAEVNGLLLRCIQLARHTSILDASIRLFMSANLKATAWNSAILRPNCSR